MALESARSAATSASSAKVSESVTSTVGGRSRLSTETSRVRDTLESSSLWRCLQEEAWEELKVEAKKPDAKVSLKDENFGWTPAHFAANSGAAGALKVLLDAKAKADAADNEGNSVLMLACRKGHLQACELLVGRKADVNVQNRNGWTALTWVAINGYEEVASLLLNSTADHHRADVEGRTACMWAARHGHLGIVETFLAFGLNLSVQDQSGLTVLDHCQDHLDMAGVVAALDEVNGCLVMAAQSNDLGGIIEAIEAGADIDLRDGDGWTPLMWAAMHESIDMVQVMVRYGAKPSLLDEAGRAIEGLTTHHLAVGEAIEAVLHANDRLLEAARADNWHQASEELAAGAFINVRDECQRTSLMWAAKHCSAEGVQMLLSKSACVNDRDTFGWAAVHYAVSERSPETVSMFHYLGADFTVKTYEGDTLLHMAVRADDGVMIQLLLAAGLDPEAVDLHMFTPLMMAAYHGLHNAVEALLAYGANIDARATEAHAKCTAIGLAVVHGHEAVVAAILQPLQAPPLLPGEVEKDEAAAAAATKSPKKALASLQKAAGVAAALSSLTKRTGTKDKEEGEKKGTGPSAKAKEAAGGVAARRKAAPKAQADFRGDNPTALITEAIRKRGGGPWKTLPPPGKVAIKQVDAAGCTPLALAVRYRRTAIGTELLHAKADVNAADDHGNTVLMEAIITRQREVVEMMLDLGANIDKRNKAGLSAVEVCDDEVIRQMLYRRTALGKVPATNPSLLLEAREREELAAAQASHARSNFRIRLENLPMRRPADELEADIRMVMYRCGAPNPQRVQIELDPITEQPRGVAYADFADAVALDLAARGDGEDVHGYRVRIYREPILHS